MRYSSASFLMLTGLSYARPAPKPQLPGLPGMGGIGGGGSSPLSGLMPSSGGGTNPLAGLMPGGGGGGSSPLAGLMPGGGGGGSSPLAGLMPGGGGGGSSPLAGLMPGGGAGGSSPLAGLMPGGGGAGLGGPLGGLGAAGASDASGSATSTASGSANSTASGKAAARGLDQYPPAPTGSASAYGGAAASGSASTGAGAGGAAGAGGVLEGLLSSLPKPTGGIPSLPIPSGGLLGGIGGGAGGDAAGGLGAGIPSLPLPSLPSLPLPSGGLLGGLGGSVGGDSHGGLTGGLTALLPHASNGASGVGYGSSDDSSSAAQYPPASTGGASAGVGASVSGTAHDGGHSSAAAKETPLPSLSLYKPAPTPINSLYARSDATKTNVAAAVATGPGESLSDNCIPQNNEGGDTENVDKATNCCTDVTILFARGPGEAGNVGAVAGPPMFKALREKLSVDKVNIQGVDYPADPNQINMGAEGGPQLAAAIKAEKSRCPTTKIFVSGYSQGAMVVHDAFKHNITSTDVEGAVLFSDPMKAQEVGDLAADKVKEICTTTDAVCAEEDASTDGPTSYEGAGEEAADWVIAAAGLA